MNWENISYFTSEEFDSPDLPGSGEDMDEDFVSMLDEARKVAGTSFVVTSGMRSPAHNRKVGGVEGSSHLVGHAADIACSSSNPRERIVSSLVKAGFNRIGIADTFIHCDNDPDKAQNVIWLYSK